MTTFCRRCVVSNHRPIASKEYGRTPGSEPAAMAFGPDGVCGACRVAERKSTISWGERQDNLRRLLSNNRRPGRPAVLCPGSGGKDSVYAAGILRSDYGVEPLTVTWRPNGYTGVGWRNFNRWLEMGFANILISQNPRVHRLLTRLAFLNLGHPFQPFVLGQRSLAPKIAAAHDIPIVVYGEDDADYEGEAGWQGNPEIDDGGVRISGVPVEELISKHGLTREDLWLYLPPSPETMSRVTVVSLGHYVRWDPQTAYYYAVEQSGFEANEERTEGTYSKYNSIDDRLDPLHYFLMYVKWGIGRATHDASQEIRNGYLAREEGVALVQKYDHEIPHRTIGWACGYMGINEAEFWATIQRFKRDYPVVA